MKKSSLFLPLLLAGGFFGSLAQASSDTPLVVVRYNAPKVFYQHQLFQAVSRAVAIKPAVMFEVVSLVPKNADATKADKETAAFVQSLNSIGVPSDHIHSTNQENAVSPNHEIHLYVD